MEILTVNDRLFENEELKKFLTKQNFTGRRAFYWNTEQEILQIENIEKYFSGALKQPTSFNSIKKTELLRNTSLELPGTEIGSIFVTDSERADDKPFSLSFGSKLFFDKKEGTLKYLSARNDNNQNKGHEIWELKAA